MEALLGSILQKYLGQMLLDFNAKKNSKFKFSLGSGQKCVLKDLKLDPEFLSKLLPGIPFEVESGVIDEITVHAHLHSIKTEPTLVDIGSVNIVFRESADRAHSDDSVRSASAGKVKESASAGRLKETSSEKESLSGESLDRLSSSSTSFSTSGKGLTNQTTETPSGTLRKCVKKHSHLAQKIGDGVHWKVREIRITLFTAGEGKRDKLASETHFNLNDPPALTLVIRDLDLYSTDEHGNKCDLKRARAFSKDHDDVSYSFKEGSCLLSIFLSPANPWFSEVPVLEGSVLKLKYVSVFEPMWQNSKGEDVTVELARSFDVTCDQPLLCHFHGDDLLHVGECIKGLYLAMFREVPLNEYPYGTGNVSKQVINIRVPEIVVSAVLDDGPGRCSSTFGTNQKGLSLKVNGLVMGMLSGPKDFESTTQVEVASISLTDLADPSQIFLSAPATAPHFGTDGASSFSGKELAHGATRETGSLPAAPASTGKGDGKGKRVQEIQWVSIHPLEMQLEGTRRSQTQGQMRKFVRFQGSSCNPMWSSFRPPDDIVESCLRLTVDSVHLLMNPSLVGYATSIQTLLSMTHALSAVPPTSAPKAHQKAQTSDLHSHGDGASPARQAGAEGTPVTGMEACECTRGEVGSVSWLELRSRLDVTDEATPPDRTLAFYFDKIHLHAEGKNTKNRSHNPLNSISFQASVMRGGLYCDDAQFAVTVDPVAKAWQRAGGGLSQTGPAVSVKSSRGEKKRGKREKTRDGGADAQGSSADNFSSPVLVLGPDTYSLAEINHVDVSGKLVVETVSAPTWRAETSGVGKAKGTAPHGFRPPGPAEGWHHHPLCNARSVRVRQVDLHCDIKLVQVTLHSLHLERLHRGLSKHYSLLVAAAAAASAETVGGARGVLVDPGLVFVDEGGYDSAAQGPVITMSLVVAHASLLVAGRQRGAIEDSRVSPAPAASSRNMLAESSWIQLVLHGNAKVQLLSGALAQLEVDLPTIDLLSRGSSMISTSSQVPCMLALTLERRQLEELRRQGAMPLRTPWKCVACVVEGLRVQLNHGFVTDISGFLADLVGLQLLGRDIGVIVSEVMNAMALAPQPPSDCTQYRRDKRSAYDADENDKKSTVPAGKSPPALRRQRSLRRESTLDTISSAMSVHSSSTEHLGWSPLPAQARASGGEGDQGEGRMRELSLAAWGWIQELPEELDVSLSDCQVEISSSFAPESRHALVSFESFRAHRVSHRARDGGAARNAPLSPPVGAGEEWDGIQFEIQNMRLTDESTAAKKKIQATGHGVSGGRLSGNADAVFSVSLLRPYSITVEMDWKVPPHLVAGRVSHETKFLPIAVMPHMTSSGRFEPHFRVSGDPIELVLQPSILLTLMGIFHEFESLKNSPYPHRSSFPRSRTSHKGAGVADPMNSLNSNFSDGFLKSWLDSAKNASPKPPVCGPGKEAGGEAVDWKARAEELERRLAKAVEADTLKEQERQNERERHRVRERLWLLERDELVGKCEHLARTAPESGVVGGAKAAVGELMNGARALVAKEKPAQDIHDVEELQVLLDQLCKRRDEAQMLVVRQRIHNQNSANLLEAAQEMLSSACLSIPHDQQGQLGMVSHLMLDLSLELNAGAEELKTLERVTASNRRMTM